MKKNIFKLLAFIVLLMLPVGIIVSFSKPKNEYLNQISDVNIKELGAYGWTVYNSDVEYLNDNVLVNTKYDTLYTHKVPTWPDDQEIERTDIKRHQDYYIYNNGTLINNKTFEFDMYDGYGRNPTVDIRSLNNNFYYMDDSTLYKYDNNTLAEVAHIELSNDYYDEYDEFYLKKSGDNLIILLTDEDVYYTDLLSNFERWCEDNQNEYFSSYYYDELFKIFYEANKDKYHDDYIEYIEDEYGEEFKTANTDNQYENIEEYCEEYCETYSDYLYYEKFDVDEDEAVDSLSPSEYEEEHNKYLEYLHQEYDDEYEEAEADGTSSTVCNLYSIDKDFKTATPIDCKLDQLNTYFPEYVIQVRDRLTEGELDYRDGELVEITSDNIIVYTDKNNNKTKIKADIGTFTNVKFFKDKIVALEDTVGNLHTNFYYSRINLYSKDGELIDQVTGLSSYEDLKVDEANNKFLVSGILLKKVISSSFGLYAYENYDASEAVLSYEEYTYKEPEPEPENPPIIPEIPIISNPETSDIIITGFVALFIISLYVYIKCKKAL